MDNLFGPDFMSALWALGEVIMINVILSGDNAVVIGMAAATLPAKQRIRAVWWGILAAAVLRVIFAIATTSLLHVIGLMVAGGVLLLWVAWKLWREIRESGRAEEAEGEAVIDGREVPAHGHEKTFPQALRQIIIADVSMSLDNVLAVAGAAMDHPIILMIGLGLSVLIMGCAATLIVKLLERYRSIAYIGLILIVYVALEMIWNGAHEVAGALAG